MQPAHERILVRGVNWLGDAVMTTPALFRLREAKPEAFIALLTPARFAELWMHHPAISSILPFAATETVFQVARRLRPGRFDTALILPNSPRSALEPFLARIPHRVGYPRPWRNLLLTDRVQPRAGVIRMRKRSVEEIKSLIAGSVAPPKQAIPPSAHQSFEYLHLVAHLGARPEPMAPRVFVNTQEEEAVRQRFGFPLNRPGQPLLLGLSPGAEYGPAKRWPRERFVAAAIELQRRTRCHCWIFGGPADRELAGSICDEIERAQARPSGSVRCLAGETSLRELCAGLKACDVLLTNDTGPMHVAAAVGTPVIVPFGSTSLELTAPGLPGDPRHALLKTDAPCSPCFLRKCPIDFRCMTGLSVEAVVRETLRVLGTSG
jgi:heptosyltransferase-2